MAAKKKSSLVGNINKRKKAGTSRAKSRSTVSPEAYGEMQQGWPEEGGAKKKRAGAKKKRGGAKKKAGAKKKTGGAKKKAGSRKKSAARK